MLNKLWARMRKKEKAKNSAKPYVSNSERTATRSNDDGIFSNPLHPLNPINPIHSTYDDDYLSRRSQSLPSCSKPDSSLSDNDNSGSRGNDSPSSPSDGCDSGGCGGD